MLLFVLLLLLISGTETGYKGFVYTLTVKDLLEGTFTVIYRYKLSYSSCKELDSVTCQGDCSKQSYQQIAESRGEWCQKQYSRIGNDRGYTSGLMKNYNWTENRNGILTWRISLSTDTRNRSDINQPNSSPQTTILPVIRIPSNCQRTITLLTFDPDGDEVRCRYASSSSSECNICTPPSVLSLSSSCTLSFSPTNSSEEVSYAVQLMMEDYPREEIIMSSNGQKWPKTTNIVFSTIPVQFVFTVDPAAPSCTEGEYLPRFLPPTPEHGAQINTTVNQTLEITIKAEATQITELLFSGPFNVVKNLLGSGHFTLKWTPSASDNHESHPICFVVQANVSGSLYQSQLRCVIVTVRDEPAPQPRTSYVKVLKVKISTTLSLKDHQDEIADAIKDELIRRGLPPGITVRLLSDGSVKITKQLPPSG